MQFALQDAFIHKPVDHTEDNWQEMHYFLVYSSAEIWTFTISKWSPADIRK